MIEDVGGDIGKVWVSVERKVNLGNYESVTLQAGLSLPHGKNVDNYATLKTKLISMLDEVATIVENSIEGD